MTLAETPSPPLQYDHDIVHDQTLSPPLVYDQDITPHIYHPSDTTPHITILHLYFAFISCNQYYTLK